MRKELKLPPVIVDTVKWRYISSVCVCVCVCVCVFMCFYFLKGDEPAVKKLKREETSNGNESHGAVQERGREGDGEGEGAVKNGGEESGKKDVGVAKTLSEVPYNTHTTEVPYIL